MCSLQRWQAHNKLSPAVHKLPDATVHRMQGAGSPWESSTWKEKTCLVSLVTKTPFVRDPSLTPLPLKDLSPVLEEDGCVPVCSFALSFTRGAYRRGWWCDIGHKKNEICHNMTKYKHFTVSLSCKSYSFTLCRGISLYEIPVYRAWWLSWPKTWYFSKWTQLFQRALELFFRTRRFHGHFEFIRSASKDSFPS